MTKRSGFSLVELSIVLIIIGLLVAGVSSGSKLIKQTKLRALIGEIEDIRIAIKTFQSTYEYVPGDLPDAYDYWGSDCGTNALFPTGCNGNGNGYVESTSVSSSESFRFWQHLQLAGLIKGTYTGVKNSSPYHVANNSYVSKYPNVLFYVFQFSSWNSWSGMNPNHTIHVNNPAASTWGWTSTDDSPFTVHEAYMIDRKMDDGMPRSGNVYTTKGWVTSWTGACGDTSGYIFTNTDGCFILLNGNYMINSQL